LNNYKLYTGSEEYDRLRPLSYPQTDVFLVCFSAGLPPSFEHVKSKWVPEAHHHCPGTPFVLVAAQIDLRADEEAVERMARDGKLAVSVHQGQRMARELGAAKYVECSAKTLEGVKDVFDQVSRCMRNCILSALHVELVSVLVRLSLSALPTGTRRTSGGEGASSCRRQENGIRSLRE
jgi:small GTP-binding protein